MKLTYEELEKKVAQLEQKASLVDHLQLEISNNNQFLDILLNTIPNPVFYKDIHGVYQKANDAFSEVILGIKKEQIIGKSLFELPEVIPSNLAQKYYEKDRKLFDNPGTQIYESEVMCADGNKRIYYFYKATVQGENRELLGLIGVMLDVTQLKENQRILNKKNELLIQLSYSDSLTGIYNRRKFDEVFPEKIKSFNRQNSILNFVLLDVDHFKLYNDTYGHYKGDNILRIIAATIKKRLSRKGDYFFRIGGEEFGIFFESNDEKKALKFIQVIKHDIEALDIEHKKNTMHKKVTLSFGLVSIINRGQESKKVYEEADRLLYEAKANGRNQIGFSVL
ncbi:GGDEF domain-containing protein [Candidatus Marinarcus aquaticus]|uniref:diguanylate cyclase n=1 Tax=Candidatus Marinarcus aquaticus TaxID=2044504 RepID=A0A4Q0XN87_9BACT|nr:GGDEF domain-containing protein [Candidatus Marinarcus aquaticus]RXJ55476.1 diguanylate cyclase [Candidatus Marinarcus aquaticus]